MINLNIPKEHQITFPAYYKKHLQTKCEDFENKRLSVVNTIERKKKIFSTFMGYWLPIGFISVIAAFINAFVFSQNFGGISLAVATTFIFILTIFFLNAWANEESNALTNEINQVMFPILLSYFGSEFKLLYNGRKLKNINILNSSKSKSNLNECKKFKLFPKFDSYIMGAHLQGKWKQSIFNFYDISFYVNYRDENKRLKNELIFNGPFIRIELQTNFSGVTRIIQDPDNIITRSSNDGLDRVQLEDPIFENEFEIYSSDQIEARYLLTPKRMELMLALSRRLGGELEACFMDNELLLKFKSRRAFFNQRLSLDNPIEYRKVIETTFSDLEYIFKIIEDLEIE